MQPPDPTRTLSPPPPPAPADQPDHLERPCLRPLEAIPDEENGRVILRDPTHLATGALVAGRAEVLLLTLLNGERPRLEIQAEFARQTQQLLLSQELDELLAQLNGAGYLSGPGFEAHYRGLLDEYRGSGLRPLRNPDGLGIELSALPSFLDKALGDAGDGGPEAGRPVGLVVPHLDFRRGKPCYGAGYAWLRRALGEGPAPDRVVILGTNHFGRSRSVVATRHDFATPWGRLTTDREFLGRLEAASGGDLAPYELDHLHEHSIELQAVWLHHLLRPEPAIVPVLCPDPCGPRGTAAGDPGGVDLRDFALALGQAVRGSAGRTLLIASADLSHVGGYFGDRVALDASVLGAARQADEAALEFVAANDPEGLREHMAATANPTRWCSIGCLFALMTAAGREARATRLHYHQATVAALENSVSSAAFALTA